jgi:16S rRNA (cytosine1402-N4)-methyltransferase
VSTPSLDAIHTPVLLDAVLSGLNLHVGKCYVDGTLGMGGHSQAILKQLASLGETHPQWVGVDQDAQALAIARVRLANTLKAFTDATQCHFVQSNYSQLVDSLQSKGIESISGGLLLDLGVSSLQLDAPERGFSFMRNGVLDMRMNQDTSQTLTAQEILNTYSLEVLCSIFERYGEEKYAYPIAKAIVADRDTTPWRESLPLARLCERVYRLKQKSGKQKESKHPATRVFQALRMAVNGELEHLESTLQQLPHLMVPQSRVAIITFHSLEDRLVKQTFKKWMQGCTCPPHFPICTCEQAPLFKAVNRKAIEASEAEKEINPRSRSAKLRIYEKI